MTPRKRLNRATRQAYKHAIRIGRPVTLKVATRMALFGCSGFQGFSHALLMLSRL